MRTEVAGRTEHSPEQPHPLRFGAMAQAGALLTPVGEARRIGSPEVPGGAAAAERLPLRRGRSLPVPAWRRSQAPGSPVPTRFTETWVGGRPTSADRRGRCEDCIHRPPRRIGMARSDRGDRPMHGAPPPQRRLELATAAGPRQHDAGPPTDLRCGS